MISITEPATQHLKTLIASSDEASKGLRIFVEKGGCAGMQYGMTLDRVQEGDEVLDQDGIQVMVDPESQGFLQGATIDYCDDLTGTGFRIQNPNAVRSCGCGTSFETTPEEGAEAHQH